MMALASGVATVLSGCTARASENTSFGEWTSSIGAGWDKFVDDFLGPLADTSLAIVISWLILAVACRLVAVVIKPVRDLHLTRSEGKVLRRIGWSIVLVTPIIVVLITATATDGPEAWLFVTPVLAFASVAILGPGLATRSRIDAKVVGADGASNSAWAVDALKQVREVNLDDPQGRVERPSSPDLGDFISVADRSGNGLASVIAWLVQLLFNDAPWLLQVTILDGRRAIATLRRNGSVIGEEELLLEWGSEDSDQHRKQLALAAAFTAMEMANRYPDVLGFYRAKNWRSVGYLGLARMSNGAERDHYLRRAIELEPRSLMAEYDRVYQEFTNEHECRRLEQLMDELEPIANQAAWLCGTPLVFPKAERKDWHDYALEPEDPVEGVREPPDMLRRALVLYTVAARNWDALVEPGRGAEKDVAERRGRARTAAVVLVNLLRPASDGRPRRMRFDRVAASYRVLLPEREGARRRREAREERDRRRLDPDGTLERTRSRAALCYLIFADGSDADLVAAADPEWTMPPDAPAASVAAEPRAIPAHARPAELLRKQRVAAGAKLRDALAALRAAHGDPVADPIASAVKAWLEETKTSVAVETRYSYACYLARRAQTLEDSTRRGQLVREAVRRVDAAERVGYYRAVALWDPELMLLGGEDAMRELILPGIDTPWEVQRFAQARALLTRHGVLELTELSRLQDLPRQLKKAGLAADDIALLVDASAILGAALDADSTGLDQRERLRAVRSLIDDGQYTVRSFCGSVRRDLAEVVRSVAAAVFWVPTPEESQRVERLLIGMVDALERRAAEDVTAAVPVR